MEDKQGGEGASKSWLLESDINPEAQNENI